MKIWQRKLALALVLVMLLISSTPALSLTDEEIYSQTVQNCKDEMNRLKSEGKLSSQYLSYSVIDLTYVDKGSVTSYTYNGDNQDLSIITHTVSPHSITDAINKIALFNAHIRTMYYPENVVLLSSSDGSNTVQSHVYGPLVNEARYAFISGLEECLKNEPLPNTRWGGGGGSKSKTESTVDWVEKYSPENIKLVTTFTLESPTYTVTSTETGDTEVKTMDAKPITKNERIFVPVRYLAYALGATEGDIDWNGLTQTVTITINKTTEKLTLGSNIMLVNDEPIEMDVAPFAENGRTFLPARWIAEPVGAQVQWDEEKQQVIIIYEQQVQEQGQ